MENMLQELEFLDLGGLSEDEKFCLQSYLDGPFSPKTNLNCSESIGEAHYKELGKGIEASEACASGGFQNAAVGHMTAPITVGFPAPASVHVYQPNMCIAATTLPQYQPISYPISMLSGAHLMGPNFFMSPPNPAIPHPGTFPQQAHHALGQQQFSRKGKPQCAKYSPRKELPNGHASDGFTSVVFPPHGSYSGSFFPGNMVQAATGVPIVMQPVSSYASPHSVRITTATPSPIYPVATFTPTTVSAAQAENEVLALSPTTDIELQPVKTQEQSVPATNEIGHDKTKQELEIPVAMVSQTISSPLKPEKELSLAPAESSLGSGKTWASLFKKDSTNATFPEKPTARVEPFISANDVAVIQAASASLAPAIDPHLRRLAEHLAKYELHQTAVALVPRGLINKRNWCYINATLQALVACSPFVHLMKSLVPLVRSKSTECTPIVESVLEFIEQFETIPIKSVKDRQSVKKEDPHIGISFEPSSIYKALSKVRSETFKVEGRQEDAEEFLSCLLNALHEEMIEIMKSNDTDLLKSAERKPNGQDEDDWQVIGPKNRGCVTHTTTYSKTPISNLFLGQMRSALHYAGAQSTATLQPFFSLQLDIQSDKVNSVRDALACLVSKEPLTGFVCSKTGQEVEASRQITLEELPPILILHLKCFVYDKSGGIQKLMKRMDFTSDLELSKEFLSPSQKAKLKEGQRKYKLFAVVYHDGKEATKGHYITEVHHAGVAGWLRFDDSIVRVVDSLLFKYSPPRMPYLLLYRKLNL